MLLKLMIVQIVVFEQRDESVLAFVTVMLEIALV